MTSVTAAVWVIPLTEQIGGAPRVQIVPENLPSTPDFGLSAAKGRLTFNEKFVYAVAPYLQEFFSCPETEEFEIDAFPEGPLRASGGILFVAVVGILCFSFRELSNLGSYFA